MLKGLCRKKMEKKQEVNIWKVTVLPQAVSCGLLLPLESDGHDAIWDPKGWSMYWLIHIWVYIYIYTRWLPQVMPGGI